MECSNMIPMLKVVLQEKGEDMGVNFRMPNLHTEMQLTESKIKNAVTGRKTTEEKKRLKTRYQMPTEEKLHENGAMLEHSPQICRRYPT